MSPVYDRGALRYHPPHMHGFPIAWVATALLAAPPSPAPTAAAAGAVTPGKPASVDPKGFRIPDLTGFDWVETRKMDASLAIEGPETSVEVYENRRGDRAMKLMLNGVDWAWGFLPGGDPTQGYVLRDPGCARKLTEKWAPDAPFSAPECAVKATPRGTPAPSPVPSPPRR